MSGIYQIKASLLTCNEEQAKRLKMFGVKQASLLTWYGAFQDSDIEPEVDLTDQRQYEFSVNGYYGHPDRKYAAFTAAELLAMLPRTIRHKDQEQELIITKGLDTVTHALYQHGRPSTSTYYWMAPSLAEALAGLLLVLLQQELTTVAYINERIIATEEGVEA